MPVRKTPDGHQVVHVTNLKDTSLHVDELETLSTATNTKLDSLISIHNNHIAEGTHLKKHNDKVKLTGSGPLVYADSSPAPTLDTNDRDGWLWTKTAADASKFNYYMYGITGSSTAWMLSDISSVHMKVSIDTWAATNSAPFVVIYTSPTGVGDAGAWYHSKISYSIDTSQQSVIVGEHITMYCLEPPVGPDHNRKVPLTNIVTTGSAEPTESVLAISIHSDSAAGIDTQILVTEMGFKINSLKRNILLV
jgi:hypothetical protein